MHMGLWSGRQLAAGTYSVGSPRLGQHFISPDERQHFLYLHVRQTTQNYATSLYILVYGRVSGEAIRVVAN